MMRPLQLKAPWQPTLRTLLHGPTSTNRWNEFSLGYPYRLNQQYALETSTDLASPQWTPVTGLRPVLDIPESLWVVRPPASLEPTRYYRILPVLPSP